MCNNLCLALAVPQPFRLPAEPERQQCCLARSASLSLPASLSILASDSQQTRGLTQAWYGPALPACLPSWLATATVQRSSTLWSSAWLTPAIRPCQNPHQEKVQLELGTRAALLSSGGGSRLRNQHGKVPQLQLQKTIAECFFVNKHFFPHLEQEYQWSELRSLRCLQIKIDRNL